MLFSIPSTISNPYFSLVINHYETKTLLCMQIFSGLTHTSSLPSTRRILLKKLPSIFSTQCFNNKNFSFIEEVKNTEIGHLFEHILLENLYLAKDAAGYKNIIIKGETQWNWYKDPHGMFHISINIKKHDIPLFNEVLPLSVALIIEILKTASFYRKGVKPIVSITKSPHPFT